MNIGDKRVGKKTGGRRRRLILWFCVAFIAVQLLVPIYKLSLPSNQAFGWQMYSSLSGDKFEVVSDDGTRRIVDPSPYVLRYRAEIDYRDHLPPILCREFTDAARIETSVPGADDTKSYPCGR